MERQRNLIRLFELATGREYPLLETEWLLYCWDERNKLLAMLESPHGDEPLQVVVLNHGGQELNRLALVGSEHSDGPSLSPNGRCVAIATWDSLEEPRHGRLIVWDRTTGEQRSLVILNENECLPTGQGTWGQPRLPSWSPDGRWLVFKGFEKVGEERPPKCLLRFYDVEAAFREQD